MFRIVKNQRVCGSSMQRVETWGRAQRAWDGGRGATAGEAPLGDAKRGAASGTVAMLAAAYRRPPGDGVFRSGPAVMMTRPPRLSRGAA
ncbi:hypothetical protein UE99_019845 [Burkholderia cenocepacia]|nr:hypothetical protein [Burkholderia cenocepacia]